MNLFFFLVGVATSLIIILVVNTILSNRQLDKLKQRLNSLDNNLFIEIDSMNKIFHQLELHLESKLDRLESELDRRFEHSQNIVDRDIESLHNELNKLSK